MSTLITKPKDPKKIAAGKKAHEKYLLKVKADYIKKRC